MKKVISLILVLVMVTALFVGCNDIKTPPETTVANKDTEVPVSTAVESVPPVVSTKPTETEEPTEVITEEPTTVATTEHVEVEVSTETPTEIPTEPINTEVGTIDPELHKEDLENAQFYEDPMNPAKLGEWVKSEYWNGDKEGGTYYWRVVDVTADCQKEIDEWNNAGHLTQFAELTQEHISYRMVTYQIYFPEDYKVGEYGASTGTKITLGAKNPEGGGFTYNGLTYLGLGQTWSIDDSSLRYQPGDVATCKSIYAMLDADITYVFEGHFTDKEGNLVYGYSASK